MKKRKKKKKSTNFHYIILAVVILGTYFLLTKSGIHLNDWKRIGIWMLIVAVAIAVGLLFLAFVEKRLKRFKYEHSTLAKVDKMDGREFEKYLKVYFEKLGYRAKTTKDSNDYGADLILTKGNEKIVVQAKRYARNIGIEAIQEIIGARNYYEADRAIVATNRYFTASAKRLAEKCDVELWDREYLFNGHLS